jgi:tRNA threonylcarbamoyladenosine biosynthesis protein TsaB
MLEARFLLGIDTCGPSGSVALGRLTGQKIEILGQIELEGRSYSATLVAAVGELLGQTRTQLGLLHAIVAVNGPGSFTGVRVGLSAAKGLCEAAGIRLAVASRLEVLASKAGVPSDGSLSQGWQAGVPSDGSLSQGWQARVPSDGSLSQGWQARVPGDGSLSQGWQAGAMGAALDAHRKEVFLRISEASGEIRELLAGEAELAVIGSEWKSRPGLQPARIAVCDEAAAALLRRAWPEAELALRAPPTAADALEVCGARVAAGEFVDVALVDGHYLRRSDAEIFGAAAGAQGV